MEINCSDNIKKPIIDMESYGSPLDLGDVKLPHPVFISDSCCHSAKPYRNDTRTSCVFRLFFDTGIYILCHLPVI